MNEVLETMGAYVLAFAIAGGLVLCMLQPFGAIW